MDHYKSILLLTYINTPVFSQQSYTFLIVIEHTKSLPTDAFILTYSLNNLYILLNHIRIPSSQYDHQDKLLITQIINTLKNSHHNITIHKVKAHTNIIRNDKADNMAKQGGKQLAL